MGRSLELAFAVSLEMLAGESGSCSCLPPNGHALRALASLLVSKEVPHRGSRRCPGFLRNLEGFRPGGVSGNGRNHDLRQRGPFPPLRLGLMRLGLGMRDCGAAGRVKGGIGVGWVGSIHSEAVFVLEFGLERTSRKGYGGRREVSVQERQRGDVRPGCSEVSRLLERRIELRRVLRLVGLFWDCGALARL